MKRILSSWWKSAAAVIGLCALVFVLLWEGKSKLKQGQPPDAPSPLWKPEQKGPVENQGKERRLALGQEARKANPVFNQADARTHETFPPGLTSLSVEERTRRVTERRELLQQAQKQSANDLLGRLGGTWGADGDSEERTALMTAFMEALQVSKEQSDEAAYEQLSAGLRDAGLPFAAKSNIASVLGSVQTPQSIQLLLDEYQETTDERLRGLLLKQIARTGDVRWGERSHEELSPALETAWRSAKDDPRLAEAIAVGLAKVGAPSGVSLLVGELITSARFLEGMSDLKEPSSRAAAAALDKVRNPNAISVLTTGLLSPDASTLQMYVCGTSLAAMGSVDATRTLLQWAATASDQETIWAERWFGKMRDTASFELVENVLHRPDEFAFTSKAVRVHVARSLQNR